MFARGCSVVSVGSRRMEAVVVGVGGWLGAPTPHLTPPSEGGGIGRGNGYGLGVRVGGTWVDVRSGWRGGVLRRL